MSCSPFASQEDIDQRSRVVVRRGRLEQSRPRLSAGCEIETGKSRHSERPVHVGLPGTQKFSSNQLGVLGIDDHQRRHCCCASGIGAVRRAGELDERARCGRFLPRLSQLDGPQLEFRVHVGWIKQQSKTSAIVRECLAVECGVLQPAEGLSSELGGEGLLINDLLKHEIQIVFIAARADHLDHAADPSGRNLAALQQLKHRSNRRGRIISLRRDCELGPETQQEKTTHHSPQKAVQPSTHS